MMQTSCINKIDLECPAAIHDFHSDLPNAPESGTIQVEDLSPYRQQLHETLHIKGAAHSKLIPSLYYKREV